MLQNGTANQNTFTLTNVTEPHTVTAVFEGAIRYEVSYAASANGTLSAKNNGAVLTLTPGQTANVWGGSKLVFTAAPDTNYMTARWTVNGTVVTRDNMAELGVKLDHYLSNTLTVESLSKAMNIQVSFEIYAGYAIPTGGTGYTVTEVKRSPADTYAGAETGEIRKNGDLSFIISPDSANEYSTISSIKMGGTELLTDDPNDNITVVKNSNGSYTVTITGVQSALDLTVTAHKLVIEKGLENYNPPAALGQNGFDSHEIIQTELETQLTGSSDGKVFYDIALKYKSGSDWVEVDAGNFPDNGVDVQLPYPEGTDKKDTFKIVHMLASGANAGTVEPVQILNRDDEYLYFHVNSLSPFGVSWTKYVVPAGGGGGGIGGGGGGAAPAETVIIRDSANGKISADNAYAGENDTVTLTVVPDEGYALDQLTVTDSNGKEITLTAVGTNKYAFTMPNGMVQVSAGFSKAVCDGGEGCPVHHYADVDTGKWYHEALDFVVDNGLMNGIDGDKFAPNGDLQRSMLMTILTRMDGVDTTGGDTWYEKGMAWAMSNGISDGTNPGGSITREQIAAMLYRYARLKGYDTSERGDLSQFTDGAKASSWATEAMQWAVASGVLQGSGGKLNPTGTASRAEVAQMLKNYMAQIG